MKESALKRIAKYEAKGSGEVPEPKRGLNRLEAKFVDLVVEYDGQKTMTDLARMAGYSESAASSAAQRLLNPYRSPHVVAAIRQREAELMAQVAVTRTRHLRDLMRLRDQAAEVGQFSAAINAEVKRGQASEEPIYIDRREIRTGDIDSMSREQVEAELAKLRDAIDVTPELSEEDDVGWLD